MTASPKLPFIALRCQLASRADRMSAGQGIRLALPTQTVADVASAIAFLGSEPADYINGVMPAPSMDGYLAAGVRVTAGLQS